MFRVRFKKDQYVWRFLPGCFGTQAQASAAMHAHADTWPTLTAKYQIVMLAWYAGR